MANTIFKDTFYAVDVKDYEENIWKKHPEETEEQYTFFMNFYVDSNTLAEASEKYSKKYNKGYVVVPKRIKHWGQGKLSNGDVIDGLHTFKERKIAFETLQVDSNDVMQFSGIANTPINNLRTEIVKQELLDADMMLKVWLLQYKKFKDFLDGNTAKNHNQNISILKDFTVVRENIAFFYRRAAGMSDKAEERILEEAAEEIEIQIDIVQKEHKLDDFEEIDFMSPEQFDQYMERVGRLESGETD